MKRQSGIDDAYVSQHWRDQPRDPKGTETGGQWTSGDIMKPQSVKKGMTSSGRFKEIANIARKYLDSYNYVGIRIQDEVYSEEVGNIFQHESFHWNDGEITPYSTNGVSAISIKTNFDNFDAKRSMNYDGNIILIIGSDYAEMGDDYGEMVFRNPTVLDIIDDSIYFR